MSISEQSRHALHSRLEAVLGPDEATTLMEHLPPIGWADVATKRDLDNLGAATRRDLDNLGAATTRELDNLQVATMRDLDNHRVATKRDLDNLEHRLRSDFRADLHSAITEAVSGQTRTVVLAVIGSNLTMAALAFAAATVR